MPPPPTVTNSPTPPANPAEGDLWFNTTSGREYVWYTSPTTTLGSWVQTQPTSAMVVTPRPVITAPITPPAPGPYDVSRTPNQTISEVPPTSPAPQPGDLWWNSRTGQQFIFYNDGNTEQWVIANKGNGLQGDAGFSAYTTTTADFVMPALQATVSVPVFDEALYSVGAYVFLPVGGYFQVTGVLPKQLTLLNMGESVNAAPGVIIKSGTPVVIAGNQGPQGIPVTVTAGVGIAITGTSTNVTVSADTAYYAGIYAPIASPTFTGDPQAPTAALGDNDNSIATTAFVQRAVTGPAGGDLGGNYPNPHILASPVNGYVLTTINGVATWTPLPSSSLPSGPAGGDLAGTYPNPTIAPNVNLTGSPTTPNIIIPGSSTDTRIANVASIVNQMNAVLPLYAPINSPNFTGTPTLANTPGGGTAAAIANVGYVTGQFTAFITSMPGVIPPGTNGQILTTVGSTTAWANAPSTAPSGPAGGALNGTYPNPGLVGGPLSNYLPINNPTFTGTLTGPSITSPASSNLTLNASAGQAIIAGTIIYPSPDAAIGLGTSFNRWTNVYSMAAQISGPAVAQQFVAPTISPPINPSSGWSIYTDTTDGVLKARNAGGTVVPIAPSGGGASISIGVTPPSSPSAGALWWYTDGSAGGGTLYIFYVDASGPPGQWVPAAAAAGSSGFPPGMVTDFAGSVAPGGWLLCDGTSYATSAYPALFAAIAYTYGGSGANFNVPDLGGRVTAGVGSRLTTGGSGINGTVLGATGGVETYALTTAQLAAHAHGTNPGINTILGIGGNFMTTLAYGSNFNVYGYDPPVANSGGGAAHQNTQPTMIMNKIIKT